MHEVWGQGKVGSGYGDSGGGGERGGKDRLGIMGGGVVGCVRRASDGRRDESVYVLLLLFQALYAVPSEVYCRRSRFFCRPRQDIFGTSRPTSVTITRVKPI